MVKHNHRHRPLALTSPKQQQGSRFEQQACQFLQQQGLILIAQNWQQPKVGELDLVMLEIGQAWSTLVFIEVRQRLRSSFGDAALSVTKTKQRKIIKTAKYFLQHNSEYADYDCRFDVIAYNITRSAVNVSSINTDKINDKNNAKNNEIDDANMANESADDSTITHQPEWLAGAFMATAW